ncbi:MAG: hypothetical protein ACO1TE_00530 [Prosthecobacter sp.]
MKSSPHSCYRSNFRSLSLASAAVGLSLCLFLSNCTTHQTVGHDFDLSRTKQLVPGQTTGEQVLALFGKPNHRFPADPTGKPGPGAGERWLYTYAHTTTKTSLSPGGTMAFLLTPAILGPDVNAAFNNSVTTSGPKKQFVVLLDAEEKVVSHRIDSDGR